jgi:Putative lumazine-binding
MLPAAAPARALAMRDLAIRTHPALGVSMKFRRPSFLLILLSILVALPLSSGAETPGFIGKHENAEAEKRAIEQVLNSYTQSVTQGDEAAFSALLLNEQIPFTSTSKLSESDADPQHTETRDYQSFKRSVFESGKRYQQAFYNIRIEQDGALAQASLDFVTRIRDTDKGGYGWKTLQLLKVQGQWKIASEFYTVYSLPDGTKP